MTWIPSPRQQVHLLATVIEAEPAGVRMSIEGVREEIIVSHAVIATPDRNPVVRVLDQPLRVGDPVMSKTAPGLLGTIIAVVGTEAWVKVEGEFGFASSIFTLDSLERVR